MPVWFVECPNCDTRNEVAAATVVVECGRVSHTGRCHNCGEELRVEQPYWRWLGLSGPPPEEAKHP
ncbi:MAG: hypothetical protein R3300_14575 [Candidatus Promineifilaceae bacterium]|nr:hypothetical protein [Candidatus Promineifilaceae bacterium]